MAYRILLLKESELGEQRVALIPEDVKKLTERGHTVFVESGAGILAGFSDSTYVEEGAELVNNDDNYANLFKDIDILVRAKRPNRSREKLESKAFKPGQRLIGALDPFLDDGHIEAYQKAGIEAYSIDQLQLDKSDKMNLLASMSDITGRLALLDSLETYQQSDSPSRLLIVGAGTAGLSALQEGLQHNLTIDILVTNQAAADKLNQLPGVKATLISKLDSIEKQQLLVFEKAKEANLIITSARQAGQKAPLLFPAHTLDNLKQGTVIIDLALSEGGNVEGSQHDTKLTLGNDVIVKNVSGYPKRFPKKASIAWSQSTYLFLKLLMETPNDALVQEAKISPSHYIKLSKS